MKEIFKYNSQSSVDPKVYDTMEDLIRAVKRNVYFNVDCLLEVFLYQNKLSIDDFSDGYRLETYNMSKSQLKEEHFFL